MKVEYVGSCGDFSPQTTENFLQNILFSKHFFGKMAKICHM